MFEQLRDFTFEHWIIVLFCIVLIVLLTNLIIRRVFKFLMKKAEKTKNLWDDAVISAIRVPLEWAVWLFGLNFAAVFTDNVNNLDWSGTLVQISKTAVVVIIAWILIRVVTRAEENLTSGEYLNKPMDLTTAKAVRKLIQLSIMITAFLVILQSYGVSVSGVLAFGGVGGIAIGFAAQDLLSNFFGALMIYLDKPFSVGDWIRSPDREIEGTVEDIGWRLTKIRTFDKRPLYVPNSVFTKIAVENPSRMSNRRIYETFGVRYKDAGKVTEIVEAIKLMLRAHTDIDQNQTMIVNLNKFNASSVDFFVYTFTKTTNWVEYHEIKQDVLLKIETLITEAGADIAFPTQTLHLASDPFDDAQTSGSFDTYSPQSPIDGLENSRSEASSVKAAVSENEGKTS